MNACTRFSKKLLPTLLLWLVCFCSVSTVAAKNQRPKFKVIAFYTAKNDAAHISFVHEANKWFSQMAGKYPFTFDSTNNWDNLTAGFLSQYQVVVFLDTRPDKPAQRIAFEQYMRNGGGWMGFHFSAFALTPSDYPQNWDWYHTNFWVQARMPITPGGLHRPYYAWRINGTRQQNIYLRFLNLHQTNGTGGQMICEPIVI